MSFHFTTPGTPGLGAYLGEALGSGATTFADELTKRLEEKAKSKRLQDILSRTETAPKDYDIAQDESVRDSFIDYISQAEQLYEKETGQTFTPQQIDSAWEKYISDAREQIQPQQAAQTEVSPKYTTAQLAEVQAVDKDLSSLLQQQQVAEERQQFQQQKLGQQKELAYIKLNEPKLVDVNERIRLGDEKARDFGRLSEIFTEDSDKLPSAFTAAMLDLDGEGGLSKVGRAFLSPEAQESIKIIVNQLKAAKGTFGARVTNFEAATFLKGLPTLLNTPEGRRQITRQLSIVNKINQLHDQGIIEAMDKAGGSGKMLFSQAERLSKKQNQTEVKMLEQMYKHPNKREFATIPPADLLKGERLYDETTKQWLVSDGNEWIPEQERN